MGSAGLALTAHLDLRGVPSLVSPVAFLPSLTPTKPSHLREPLHWPCPYNPIFMSTWPSRLLKQPRLRSSPDSPLQALARSLPSAFRIQLQGHSYAQPSLAASLGWSPHSHGTLYLPVTPLPTWAWQSSTLLWRRVESQFPNYHHPPSPPPVVLDSQHGVGGA